ncbi:MAG TPA: hypothetical protein VGH87_19285 [Polyangiaceae bacterium]
MRLLAATTAFEGIRAGTATFRAIIDMPARSSIGNIAFAELSRATDLSARGVVYYVLYGFGGALLTGATWIAARRGRADAFVRRMTGVAFTCSLVILVLTTQAAPLMWRVGSSPNDPVLLGDLLDRFSAWSLGRVIATDVSFAAMLFVLAHLASRSAEPA